MGKKKPRKPGGYRVQIGDRILERRVIVAKTWEHRPRLVEVDARYGMNGAWVHAIDDMFDEAWLREQVDAVHHVARAMSWPLPHAILALAEVADLVLAVRAAESGADSVLKRLRVHEQYVGASYEARVARWLYRAPLPFQYASSTGPRAADIAVGGPTPFGIEVKHVAKAERSQVERQLTFLISPSLWFARDDVSRFGFHWSGPEVQKTPLPELTGERLHEIARRVEATVHAQLESAAPGDSLEIAIEGVGTAVVSLDAPPDRQSFQIETYGDGERDALRLAKQLHEAAAQIDPSMPGIVVLAASSDVVSVEHAAVHIDEVLSSAGGEWGHLAGAIVLGASAEWSTEQTIPVANPHAHVRLDALPLPQAQAASRTNRFEDFGDLFTWPD
jgi:hypothetical protein